MPRSAKPARVAAGTVQYLVEEHSCPLAVPFLVTGATGRPRFDPTVLVECKRVLRPGGRIVVIGVSGACEQGPDCDPIYTRRMLIAAGFAIKEAEVRRMWAPIEIVLAVKESGPATSDRPECCTECGDRAVMKLLSPDARAERRLAICLALIAGYVDAYALRAFATYVSFMSGNTTQTGSMTGQGKLAAALPSAVAIVLFVVGSFAGTWLTHSGLRHSRQILFGAVAALLAVIIGVMQPGSLDAKVGIATLSLSMGMHEHNAVPGRRGTGESDLCDGHAEQDREPPRAGVQA